MTDFRDHVFSNPVTRIEFDPMKMQTPYICLACGPDFTTRCAEFHRTPGIDLPVRDMPVVPPDNEVRLRARLLVEEVFETLMGCFDASGRADFDKLRGRVNRVIDSATVEVDMEEVFDGLEDIDVIVEGTRCYFGLRKDPYSVAVHRANVAKASGGKRADGKLQKPEGWKPPDTRAYLIAQGWTPPEGK